jgi:hypothetical protein
MLEVSPIKFGLVQPLENMVEFPMVTFSKSVYDRIKKTMRMRKLVISSNEVQQVSAGEAPRPVASPAQSTEDSAGSEFGVPSGLLPVESDQPVMHGNTSIGELHAMSIASSASSKATLSDTSHTADSVRMGGIVPDGEEQFSTSPFVTPVGVNKVQRFALLNDNDHTNNTISCSNQCIPSKVFGAPPSCNPSMSEVISF